MLDPDLKGHSSGDGGPVEPKPRSDVRAAVKSQILTSPNSLLVEGVKKGKIGYQERTVRRHVIGPSSKCHRGLLHNGR